jgi:hypothetical protein
VERPPLDDPGFVWTREELAVAAELSIDLGRWQVEFDGLMGLIAGRFARVESRRLARDAVSGLMSPLAVKNCWTLAEHAGHDSPDGLQHLLRKAKWDTDGVRDDLRRYVVERLGETDGVLVDEEEDVGSGVGSPDADVVEPTVDSRVTTPVGAHERT